MSASKEFDATDDFITVTRYSDVDDVLVDGGTISAWIFKDQAVTGHIFQKGQAWLSGSGWGWTSTVDEKIIIGVVYDGNIGRWDAQGINFGEWTNIATVFNTNDTSQVKTYFNAIEQSIVEIATPSGTYVSDSSENIILGKRPGDTNFFEKNLCYLQLFDRILTQPEIKEIMHKPGSIRDGLVGFWPLTDDGSTQRNLSGIGNTGAVTGATNSNDGPPVTCFK